MRMHGLGIVTLFLLTGCASMASPDRFAQTGPVQNPKPASCNYQLLTTVPSAAYVEVGVIDCYRSQVRDTAQFMEGIRELVCKAGGDAVIAEKSTGGYYVKGTVVKFQR